MMDSLVRFVVEVWSIFASMAPYLILGFGVASVLSIFVKPAFVRAHLGTGGFGQIVKASILGVPLPLCSCGVLPVAASLRARGASRGATLSFLTSTPQTGVDSIMITYALLGPVFTLVRVIVAFVSGIVCGSLTEFFSRKDAPQDNESDPELSLPPSESSAHRLVQGLRHGFVVVARSIARPTLGGILIAAVLTTFIPERLFLFAANSDWISMAVMIAVGLPLYVCSSGSVPLAYAFIAMGISPGAALVFLIVGPATNMAAVTTVWRQLGGKAVSVYLASLSVCAIVAGVLFDSMVELSGAGAEHAAHADLHVSAFHHVAGICLFAVFAPALRPSSRT